MARSLRVSATINVPVKEVWEVFMDAGQLPHWLSGFVSTEHLEGEKGQKGGVSRVVLEECGRQIEMLEEILEVAEHHRFYFKMMHKHMDTINDIRFIPLGGRTEMIQTTQLHPKGALMKLMTPFWLGPAKKKMAHDLQRLKQLVESSN